MTTLSDNSIQILSTGGSFLGRDIDETIFRNPLSSSRKREYIDLELFPAAVKFFREFSGIRFTHTYNGETVRGHFYLKNTDQILLVDSKKFCPIGYMQDVISLLIDEQGLIYSNDMYIYGNKESLITSVISPSFGKDTYDCINKLLLSQYFMTIHGLVFEYDDMNVFDG
jgi:hypothetical protein